MRLFGRKKKAEPAPVIIPTEIFTDNIDDLRLLPQGISGGIDIFGSRFHFHDAISFYNSYLEILQDQIYRFSPASKNPVIIDCGANMGVSVLYFAREYPTGKIIAFEPEESIYNVLKQNVTSYNLINVEVHQKAVWNEATALAFTTDHGMGGSVTNTYQNQTPVLVETVRLADYLHHPVDLLKLDIEGAEYVVLKDCEHLLSNVHAIFVEYHSFINKEQVLEEILHILRKAGFRYHLKHSFERKSPFVDRQLACENMDMAIEIFAYRQ